MKRSIMCLLCLFIVFTPGFANTLHSFHELKLALCTGKRFVIVLQAPSQNGGLNTLMGSFSPHSLMLLPRTETAPERIMASHQHFSDHSGVPLYEYVHYTFHEDDSVTVRCAFYHPATFEPVLPEHILHSTLGEGVEVFLQ